MYLQLHIGVAQESELRDVSSCVCPECELVVECTITGRGATVWQGTIFDGCQNEKITLRHSQFTSGTVINRSCGTRQPIVGRSVSVANRSFVSQLLVNVSEDLVGKTIECANESGHIFGSKQIDTLSGKYAYQCNFLYNIISDAIDYLCRVLSITNYYTF